MALTGFIWLIGRTVLKGFKGFRYSLALRVFFRVHRVYRAYRVYGAYSVYRVWWIQSFRGCRSALPARKEEMVAAKTLKH